MKTILTLLIATVLFVCVPLPAEKQPPSENDPQQGESWTKTLKDRSKRGTLRDAFQKVRGDSGKWNDEPRLQHAPSIKRKPPRMSLDDWADSLQRKKLRAPTGNDENWLLFKTRQLDDNDRVWVEKIERRGNQFTIVLSQAIWQGRYFKTFTYYNVFGVNLGKLPPGEYKVKWIVEPLIFRKFEGSGRRRDKQGNDNWPKDERPAEKQAKELSAAFTVATPSQ